MAMKANSSSTLLAAYMTTVMAARRRSAGGRRLPRAPAAARTAWHSRARLASSDRPPRTSSEPSPPRRARRAGDHQRQGDEAEQLRPPGALDQPGVVVVLRNAAQACEQQDETLADLEQRHDHDRGQRGLRIDQPGEARESERTE